MHISEGVLSVPVLALGWGTAVVGIGIGLKKTPPENLPKTALVSGVLFLVSLVHVPLGPSSIHLTCLGLAGMLLGWSAVPALFVALLLQGVLFQFGGLVSLGANTTIMGAAALAGYGIGRYGSGKRQYLFAFTGGFVAILIGSLLVTLALVLSNRDLTLTAGLIFAANLPLAGVEGLISVFMFIFLSKMLPDYVPGPAGI
ncbi:MAG: cobalt transporter CbiM [Treponema sp.]|jgi:cobalt/nickel transport system permease protein|nr:cobalt transporter CbiM [Treponema sp.]